jgi:hypothetical protein
MTQAKGVTMKTFREFEETDKILPILQRNRLRDLYEVHCQHCKYPEMAREHPERSNMISCKIRVEDFQELHEIFHSEGIDVESADKCRLVKEIVEW